MPSGTAFLFLAIHLRYINTAEDGESLIPVILCGDSSDSSIANALIPALARCGGVCYSGQGRVLAEGGGARFFLVESDSVPKIGMQQGILLFKKNISRTDPAAVPPGFFCVLGSSNTGAMQLLRGSGAAVVSCGTGPKDTLSLAGRESSCAAVSLQRNLVTLGGELLEPRDFRVELTAPRSTEQILLVGAVLLLSGDDPENGYVV